jgi:hypothetical protein
VIGQQLLYYNCHVLKQIITLLTTSIVSHLQELVDAIQGHAWSWEGKRQAVTRVERFFSLASGSCRPLKKAAPVSLPEPSELEEPDLPPPPPPPPALMEVADLTWEEVIQEVAWVKSNNDCDC